MTVLEKLIFAHLTKKFTKLMAPESLLSYWQEFGSGFYPETEGSIPQSHILYLENPF